MMNYTDPNKLYFNEPVVCQVKLGKQQLKFDSRIIDLSLTQGVFLQDKEVMGKRLPVGTTLDIFFFRSDSAYYFSAKILSRNLRKGWRCIRVPFPKRIVRSNIRSFLRNEIHGVIQFTSEVDPSVEYKGYIIDVSAGGVQFSTLKTGIFDASASPVGETFAMNLTFEGGKGVVGVVGKVLSTSLDPSKKGNVIVRAKFVRLTERQRNKLEMIARKSK